MVSLDMAKSVLPSVINILRMIAVLLLLAATTDTCSLAPPSTLPTSGTLLCGDDVASCFFDVSNGALCSPVVAVTDAYIEEEAGDDDKDEVKWKSYQKKNNLGVNQFIIDNDFASAFSKYFDIQEIPRYILISKGGVKVLNARMPLPALQEEFEEELKKYLN